MTLLRKFSWLKLNRIVWALLLAGFFWGFQNRTLKAYFGPDEMMNIYGYWQPPLWKVALSDVAFWSSFVRPMAAIYYLPLFHFFHLNPVPYTVARMLLLAANTWLFYKLARILTGSWWVAVLASFPVAYHAGLGYLGFDGAYIYDVLCGGFFFGALLYYVCARRSQPYLSVRQTCVFLAIYVCALDSKEMGVSLAVVVFAYELLLRWRGGTLRELLRQFAAPLAAGLVTLVYVIGKSAGAASLTNMDAYRPVFTWARFSESSVRFLNEMFYGERITIEHAVTMWALLLCAGIIGLVGKRRNPLWMFLFVWVMVTPLPIVFLPGRGGALLYLIAAGWSLTLALMLRSASWRLSREMFRGRAGRLVAMTACLLICAGEYAKATRAEHRYAVYGFLLTGKQTADVIGQLRELHLQPKPGARILFVGNPLPHSFDMTFISSLVWNDRTLHIWQQDQSPMPPADVAHMDYLIDYKGGRFIVLQQPKA